MKKTIIIIVVIALAAFGYKKLSSVELDFESLRGKTKKVGRGDLTIPITATGEVSPLSRHDIKSEASGEVLEITREPGQIVRRGDLLVRLKKDDEQRSVNRATADVTRTKANLQSAKIRKTKLETVGIRQAQAQFDETKARLDFAEFNHDKIKELDEKGRASPDEVIRIETSYRELTAALDLAKSRLEDARIAVDLAEQDVILAQAAYDQVLATLGDAQERLAETDIYSPVDGIVVKVNTQPGAVIQGGKTTFTAGTLLAVVADVTRLYVRAEVDEADIGAICDLAPQNAQPGYDAGDDEPPAAIEVGTPVTIRVDAFPGEEFAGTIERIHPEPNSRMSSVVTYRVDIMLTSENRDKLLLGMQADVEFTAQSAINVLLVPHEAIKRNDFEELGVYIPQEGAGGEKKDPKFVPCEFGLDNGMYAEVISGIEEGATVYTVRPRKTRSERRREREN